MTYWLPKLEAAGIPSPKTSIVRVEDWPNMIQVLDGKASPAFDRLVSSLREVAAPPCFLRTGHTSGKHSWQDTCMLESLDDLPQHVASLIEFSECCDFLGLPYGVWAVRELLPTRHLFRCARYGGFPVVREYRFFIRAGAVECHHPYWPKHALEQGCPDAPDWQERAAIMFEEPPAECHELARRVAGLFDGWWSVDLLETDRGWFVTDMAIGERSFHWEGCPHAVEEP